MMNKLAKRISNTIIYCLCVLFVFSSFYKLMPYTLFDTMMNNDNLCLILLTMIIPMSFVLGHHLYRIFLIIRLPVSEWKTEFLK